MKPWKVIFFVVFSTFAFRAVKSIFVTVDPAPVEKNYTRSESTFVPEAAAQAPAEPEPEPEPEKISVWSGECYGQSGTKLWTGKAVNITSGEKEEFTDEMGGKKVEINGTHNCVWRYELDRIKKESDQ